MHSRDTGLQRVSIMLCYTSSSQGIVHMTWNMLCWGLSWWEKWSVRAAFCIKLMEQSLEPVIQVCHAFCFEKIQVQSVLPNLSISMQAWQYLVFFMKPLPPDISLHSTAGQQRRPLVSMPMEPEDLGQRWLHLGKDWPVPRKTDWTFESLGSAAPSILWKDSVLDSRWSHRLAGWLYIRHVSLWPKFGTKGGGCGCFSP